LVYLYRYPADTFPDPPVIEPKSAASPILATAEPLQNTEPLPPFTAAVCGAQAGEGGKGCATVGSPFLATSLPFANTDP
jgi:hypothetical protein